MKIVHVLPALTKGGGERVVVDLANEQSAAGHEVTVLAAFPTDLHLLQEALQPAVAVLFVTDTRRRVGKFFVIPSWLVKHRSWIGRQDIVHCHLTFGAVIGSLIQVARFIGNRRTPAVVETYHAVGVPIPRAHRWLHALMAERRDGLAIMAEDPFWRSLLARRRGATSKLIHNGVASRPTVSRLEAAEYRRSVGIPANCKYVVGTIGRLEPERRPDIYIPVFRALADAYGTEVHFLLGGDGSQREAVQSLVRQAGLEDHVHMPGLVQRPELAHAAMDLYVTLNVGEVTGVAALEAVQVGTPVIALQLLPDHKPSPDGFIWSDPDPTQVGRRAVELISSDIERQAIALSQKAKLDAEFSAEAMAKAYEELYTAVLRERRG